MKGTGIKKIFDDEEKEFVYILKIKGERHCLSGEEIFELSGFLNRQIEEVISGMKTGKIEEEIDKKFEYEIGILFDG